MARWVKVPTTNLDSLSFTPRTHIVGLPQGVSSDNHACAWGTCARAYTHTHTYTHKLIINVILKTESETFNSVLKDGSFWKTQIWSYLPQGQRKTENKFAHLKDNVFSSSKAEEKNYYQI